MKVIESSILLLVLLYIYYNLHLIFAVPVVFLLIRELFLDYNYKQVIIPRALTAYSQKPNNNAETNGKKICVVTGASGFIGRFMVEKLLQDGNYDIIRAVDLTKPKYQNTRVENLTGDITKQDDADKFCDGATTVFHIAGLVSLRDIHQRRTRLDLINVKGAQIVANACVKNRVKRLIHLSSASAGFDGSYAPLDENSPASTFNSGYGQSKKDGEDLVLKMKSTGLQVVAFRPCYVYGEGCKVYSILKSQPILSPSETRQISYIYGGHVAEWLYLGDKKLEEEANADPPIGEKESKINGRFFYIGENYFRTEKEHDSFLEETLEIKIKSFSVGKKMMKIVTMLIEFVDWYTCSLINSDVFELNRSYLLYSFYNFTVNDSKARQLFNFKETFTREQITQNIKNHYSGK